MGPKYPSTPARTSWLGAFSFRNFPIWRTQPCVHHARDDRQHPMNGKAGHTSYSDSSEPQKITYSLLVTCIVTEQQGFNHWLPVSPMHWPTALQGTDLLSPVPVSPPATHQSIKNVAHNSNKGLFTRSACSEKQVLLLSASSHSR